ncbi:zinc uptake protein ZrgA [Vibrio ziniensis]|uniref:DUF2796 domain-containing protein n=1 Tax=Vibrio ziniensis TaxID=2711221 RepID=A0A6G7CF84_9VIBR|nr:DUF2796 domain-containing protein [Vibrio ziniensis]QIH40749.1 DUF2796 domain-containing protein [Vibrio ziniensis]
MFNKPLLALSITTALTTSAFAQEEFRQHEAHVHGHVELNIAQDGHDLLMEITAPGADVVGFEHAPENDEQNAVLAKALETLGKADAVFALSPAAKCHIESTNVKHNLGGEHEEHEDHDHEGHDDHADHDHKDHDDHAKHDHDSHEGHEHEEGSSHGSFTVQYSFHCDDIAKLNKIEIQWFSLFPATQEIDVNLLTDKVQTALELKPSNAIISL